MGTLSRRSFIKLIQRGLAFGGLAAFTAPVVAFFFPARLEEMPSEPLLIGASEEIPVNGSKTVRFGRYPALVIHTPDGLHAYSAICTHFACIVKWDSDLGQIVCPCHEGFFDPSDGRVLSGPPPSPLQSLAVQIIDGQIFLGGEA